MILLTVFKKICWSFSFENTLLTELVNILTHHLRRLDLFIVLYLQKQSIDLEESTKVMQQFGVCVFLQKLFNDKSSFGDSTLTKVNAS